MRILKYCLIRTPLSPITSDEAQICDRNLGISPCAHRTSFMTRIFWNRMFCFCLPANPSDENLLHDIFSWSKLLFLVEFVLHALVYVLSMYLKSIKWRITSSFVVMEWFIVVKMGKVSEFSWLISCRLRHSLNEEFRRIPTSISCRLDPNRHDNGHTNASMFDVYRTRFHISTLVP